MSAREFLLQDPKINEAVSNGYDIRLQEHEVIEKMELYAQSKQPTQRRDEALLYEFASWLGEHNFMDTGLSYNYWVNRFFTDNRNRHKNL